MINNRNNCFYNSTLQALFHIPTVANCLREDFEDTKNCKSRECITCKFTSFFNDTQSSEVPYNPYRLYESLKKAKNKRFVQLLNGKQQDPHEFLLVLVQELESQKHSARWFVDRFTVNIRTHVECLSCGTIHKSNGEVADFTLSVRGNQSIQSAVDTYFEYAASESHCISCKDNKKSKMKYFLLNAPDCLCLHLRRFNKQYAKMKDDIEISSELKLSKYFLEKQACEWNYKLVAVINHFGESLHVGHYNTVVLNANDDCYEFDDRSVRKVSSSMISANAAYLLFYELQEVILFR